MITKTDLNQIRGVVREEVDNVVEEKLKPIKKDLKYIKKTANLIIKNYDEADVILEKRVNKLEEHLRI